MSGHSLDEDIKIVEYAARTKRRPRPRHIDQRPMMDSGNTLLGLPADIQEAASGAYNDELPEGQALWQLLPSYFQDQVLLAIAKAIVAERERCVALARAFRETTTEGREELASDIRIGKRAN